MTAGDDVVERSDAGLYESLVDIIAHVARWRAVERQVAALRSDDEIFARDAVLVGEYL